MSDLDDFFAKKDRKKSKGKKFATADEIAKRLEETGRRSEKIKKDKVEIDDQGNAIQDEDEWREFEEEKKDYSGLKIQNLTLAEYDSADEGGSGGEGEDEMELEENEAGELVPKKKNGPWRVLNQVVEETATVEETPVPVMQAQTPAPPQNTGSYIPPAMRNQTTKLAAQTPFNARLRRKVAPDVRSEELFPTLSAANTQEAAVPGWPKKKPKDDSQISNFGGGGVFEEVKRTGRYEPPHIAAANQKSAAPPLELGNKFGALDTAEQT